MIKFLITIGIVISCVAIFGIYQAMLDAQCNSLSGKFTFSVNGGTCNMTEVKQ